jgi:REP element-mobilizing transposase RayT
MTAPREVVAGRTYLITRRCTQRQFLLRPSRITNQLVRYCLGVAALQTAIELHAVCFMSNHWHGVVTDPSARLPEFLERFHRLLARAQNTFLGRSENLWSSEKTSVVLLVSDEDVLEKMAYTMTNPTAAGLVRSPQEWPGVITFRIGEACRVEMPRVFFDRSGGLPQSVLVSMVRPPVFASLDDRSLAKHLACAVERLVRNARASLLRRGVRFLGVKGILRQPLVAVAASTVARRRLNPRVAARDTNKRVNALRGLIAFRRAYRCAFNAWRSGLRDVIFPAGTYALRVFAGVACAAAHPS